MSKETELICLKKELKTQSELVNVGLAITDVALTLQQLSDRTNNLSKKSVDMDDAFDIAAVVLITEKLSNKVDSLSKQMVRFQQALSEERKIHHANL